MSFFQDNLGRLVPEGQTILDFTEAQMMGWQWHQLDHMQVICTLLQKITMPAPHHSVYYGLDAIPAVQPTASNTEG